ncbi:hypothetical protein CI238_00376 [Colletotrichum incanum]|uniref:Xylanolytic transcriptional activator regulatory domain-containing protein n=1 Tax=Colletotrichum incanum TaxID=1573173 RepID=A0A167BFR8_COLIC|nr:hypothetical protein CI238_00376 [Colletotrichum incanum]OHW93098.1 fungal specific transcription factor domain-containing protein [Colletotrichum incanum]
MFRSSRDHNIRRFTMGNVIALRKSDYQRNYDMVALQSLLLYLKHHDRHAAWVISGMVIRIAQKMDYHRDGENLNLTPFEIEMRRRIWWQIIQQDAKNCLTSGWSHSLLPTNWDIKTPQNINDADLFPRSLYSSTPRKHPTEMAFCLIGYQVASFLVRAEFQHDTLDLGAGIMGDDMLGERDFSFNMRTERYKGLLTELEDCLREVETHYLDANAGSTHVAALSIRPMLISKLKMRLVPMREQPEWGTEILSTKDNLFKILLMNVKHSTDVYETMNQTRFIWYFKLHFQLDIFTAMTGQLCRRPT